MTALRRDCALTPPAGANLSRRITSPSHRDGKPAPRQDVQATPTRKSSLSRGSDSTSQQRTTPGSAGRRPVSVHAPAITVPQVGDATVQRFFQEIAAEVRRQGRAQEFLGAANAALNNRALTRSPVLEGMTFESSGKLPEQSMREQYRKVEAQLGSKPLVALKQALSDLMFFLLFQAGELLESSADEALARRVKGLVADLDWVS